MSGVPVNFTLLSEHAYAPSRALEEDTSWDLFAAHAITIPPRQYREIIFDLSIGLPPVDPMVLWSSQIRPKLEKARQGLLVIPATIDRSHEGSISAMAYNMTGYYLNVNKGDAVAELVVMLSPRVDFLEA